MMDDINAGLLDTIIVLTNERDKLLEENRDLRELLKSQVELEFEFLINHDFGPQAKEH